MALPVYQLGSIPSVDDFNAYVRPQFDVDAGGEQFAGHYYRLTDASLANEPGNIKSNFYGFYNALLVTAGTGLSVSYNAGIIQTPSGTQINVPGSTAAIPNNATSYLYVDQTGAVNIGTSYPSGAVLPIAEVVAANGAITSVTDLRNRAAFPIPGATGTLLGNPQMAYRAAPSTGWVFEGGAHWVFLTMDNIRTIGNASSGADIAQAWCLNLFEHLYTNDSNLILYNGAGSAISRTTDYLTAWNAGNRLAMPDFRNMVPRGMNNSETLGVTVGADTVTLESSQMPPIISSGGDHTHTLIADPHTHTLNEGSGHTHTGTTATHTHTGTTGAHTHAVNDPGHAHGGYTQDHSHSVADSGHLHSLYPLRYVNLGGGSHGDGGEVTNVAGGSNSYPLTTTSGTGIGIYNSGVLSVQTYGSATGITISSATASSTIAAAPGITFTTDHDVTGATIASTTVTGTTSTEHLVVTVSGGSETPDAVSIIPQAKLVHYIMFAG